MVPVRIQCLSNLFHYDTSTLADQKITKSGRKGLIRVRWLTMGCYAAMVALFCTASQQYFDRVDFKGESSCRISFTYVWRYRIQVLVGQEVVGRKLMYAHAPLSFPVELWPMYRGQARSRRLRIGCWIPHDPAIPPTQEKTPWRLLMSGEHVYPTLLAFLSGTVCGTSAGPTALHVRLQPEQQTYSSIGIPYPFDVAKAS